MNEPRKKTNWPITATAAVVLVFAAPAGCSPPLVESRFSVGEEVTVTHPLGHTFKGTVRQHDRSRGFLVSYYDDRMWTTREEWLREDQLTSLSPNPSARPPKKDLDFSPLYQAMGRASGGAVLIVLVVLLAVWAVNRRKSPPPASKSVIR